MMVKASDTYDMIIIGSGLSGLLCGNILAREGMRVCLLEQHHQPGGCLQTFRRKGVAFETGVHYFGGFDPGQTLYRYWNYFGLTNSLELERMDPEGFDQIGFPGAEFPIAIGAENFVERLLPFFPGQRVSLQQYVKALNEIVKTFPLYNLENPVRHEEEHYKNKSAAEFFNSFNEESALCPPPSAFRHLPSALRPHLSSILSGNNLLYAGNPGKTPLHIAAVINHSFMASAWRPVDGSAQIAKALLKKFRSHGGELLLSQPVDSIGYDGQGFMVRTSNGLCLSSSQLVSSIHPAKTIAMMDATLFRKSFTERITTLKNTISSFAIHAVLKKGRFQYLKHNYYYHASEPVWTGEETSLWPANYMLQTPAPAAEDGFAESLVIMSPMAFRHVKTWENTHTGDRGKAYLEFKEKSADQLLKMAELRFPGIRDSIDFMEVSTPLTWRDYTGVPEGSMYGIERDFNDPLVTNILPRTKVPGLWFTGQNINLHGVLGVTIGSVLTCGEILGLEYLLNKIRNCE